MRCSYTIHGQSTLFLSEQREAGKEKQEEVAMHLGY